MSQTFESIVRDGSLQAVHTSKLNQERNTFLLRFRIIQNVKSEKGAYSTNNSMDGWERKKKNCHVKHGSLEKRPLKHNPSDSSHHKQTKKALALHRTPPCPPPPTTFPSAPLAPRENSSSAPAT